MRSSIFQNETCTIEKTLTYIYTVFITRCPIEFLAMAGKKTYVFKTDKTKQDTAYKRLPFSSHNLPFFFFFNLFLLKVLSVFILHSALHMPLQM